MWMGVSGVCTEGSRIYRANFLQGFSLRYLDILVSYFSSLCTSSRREGFHLIRSEL